MLLFKYAAHVCNCGFSEGVQLFDLIFCLFHPTCAQVLEFLQLIAFVCELFVHLFKPLQFPLKLVPSYLASDLVLLHAVQDVLITLSAQRRIYLLILDLLHHPLQLLDLCLKLKPLFLYGLYLIGHEVRLIFVFELLKLLMLDLQPNSAARGLEMHEVLSELRIFIIFCETDLGCSFSSVDKTFHLVASGLEKVYLIDASALA